MTVEPQNPPRKRKKIPEAPIPFKRQKALVDSEESLVDNPAEAILLLKKKK